MDSFLFSTFKSFENMGKKNFLNKKRIRGE
jgi:hypothetical protein